MSSDSVLKKEFRKSDVERARNLVNGTYGNSTKTQIGFRIKDETVDIHKEGDIWEDMAGKRWTIEDGIKVSISKLSAARKLHNVPLLCPKCGKPMNSRLDKKMYPIHGFCYDCVLMFERDLKRAGMYQEYESQVLKENITSFVADLKDRVEEMRKDVDVRVTTEDGTVENWGKASTAFVDGLEEWANLLVEKID